MNQETDKKPSKPVTLGIDSGSDDPVASMVAYATGNWKELLTGLALAAIVIVSVSYYRTKSSLARERAFTQLAVASSASQMNEILSQFPGSKAAELAAFMIARTQYDAGQYPEADQSYADFLKNHPKHFLAPAAVLGRIHCREASGQFEEALTDYAQFVSDYPAQTALGLVAHLGEARCLRQTGKLGEAVAVYENLILENGESDWQPLIEDLKASATRELERLSQPMALGSAPASPTPAP